VTATTTTTDGPRGPADAPRHQVPTHLDVEDRPFCGLTVRQLLWLAAGGAWAYAAWSACPALPAPLRMALAGACVLLPAVLVAVRPAGRGLGTWTLAAARYALAPRVAVWRPAPAPPPLPPATGEPLGDVAPPRSGAPNPAHGAEAWVAWAPAADWARRPSAPAAGRAAVCAPSVRSRPCAVPGGRGMRGDRGTR
jgi:PrgI family protein